VEMKRSGYQDDSHYYEMCDILVHDSVKVCEIAWFVVQ